MFGAYAAALMKKTTPVKGSKPDSKTTSSGKTSPGKQPPSDTKGEKGGGGRAAAAGISVSGVLRDESNSVTSEEKCKRSSNSNKVGQPDH